MDGVRITGMWLQGGDNFLSQNSELLMVFVGLVAIALVAQAVAMIVMAIGAAKARKHGLEMAEDLKLKILPVIAEAHALLRDSGPKIKVITENLVETSHVVRAKAAEFDATLSDMNERTRMQVARMDSMVGKTLATTAEISTMIENAVRMPVREVAGIMNGLKAGLDVLIGKAKYGFGRRQPAEPDRDVY